MNESTLVENCVFWWIMQKKATVMVAVAFNS